MFAWFRKKRPHLGDPDFTARLALLESRREDYIQQAYEDVFSGEAGRLVLADILMRAGIVSSQRNLADKADVSHTLWHNEGMETLALEIYEMSGRGLPELALRLARKE